jgi:hypothetical protein
MRAMAVIAAMVVSLFFIPLSYADTDHGDKSKQTMEKKQADKDKEKKTPETGSMGEERTGGSGPSGTSGGGNVKAPQHEGADKKKH